MEDGITVFLLLGDPGRLDGIAANAGKNDHGVGWSGISGEMKGAVHRAESQCASDGGAEKERG